METSSDNQSEFLKVEELAEDTFINSAQNWASSMYKRGDKIEPQDWRNLLYTYTYLNSLQKGQSTVKAANGTIDAVSDYVEPSVVHGMFTVPKYVQMSDEVSFDFSITKDWPQLGQPVDAFRFRQIWTKILFQADPYNSKNAQYVPVDVAQTETIDSDFPKVFRGQVHDFKQMDATQLPMLLKDNLEIYGPYYFNRKIGDYINAFAYNLVAKCMSAATSPARPASTPKGVSTKDQEKSNGDADQK